jgi:hypothetical protein
LHHRCRSGIRSLRKADAEKRGVSDNAPDVGAQEGFGQAPDQDPVWKPDPKKHDADLLGELEKKSEKKPKLVVVSDRPEHDPDFWHTQLQNDFPGSSEAVGWGRAMQERGLDRPVSELRAELKRLHKAGLPNGVAKTALDSLDGYDANLPLRGQVILPIHRFAATLSEHTRTINAIGAVTMKGMRDPIVGDAKAFFGLLADSKVLQPDFKIKWTPGIRSKCLLSKQLIKMGERDATILVHEWAHAIEKVDERALRRSVAFLKARTKGESLVALKKLEPHLNYRLDEYARPDKFFTPYMGKNYSDHRGVVATEVTSMGYEQLAGGSSLPIVLDTDPDLVHFLFGQLAGR